MAVSDRSRIEAVYHSKSARYWSSTFNFHLTQVKSEIIVVTEKMREFNVSV